MILHGSRSGTQKNTAQEYRGTVDYVQNGAGGLGWNLTVGDDELAIHLIPGEWGWNAFGASQVYLAVEFAQALEIRPISDAQVRAFAWYFVHQARKVWPNLPLHFPTHAEVEHSGEIQHAPSGKTDVFSYGSPKADELRARIVAEIKRQGG